MGAAEPVLAAAQAMEVDGVGHVVLVEDGEIRGMVTDHDIAVRAVARGLDPATTPVADIATFDVTAIVADASIDDAMRLMREGSLERVLVVNGEMQLAGVVRIEDLGAERLLAGVA
jgi:CBS domain-containing protein